MNRVLGYNEQYASVRNVKELGNNEYEVEYDTNVIVGTDDYGHSIYETESRNRYVRLNDDGTISKISNKPLTNTQNKLSENTNSSVEYRKIATSILTATENAKSTVDKMTTGQTINVGPYTYTKMNSGKFSYEETGGGYRVISEYGVVDAIVDHTKITKRR